MTVAAIISVAVFPRSAFDPHGQDLTAGQICPSFFELNLDDLCPSNRHEP